MKRQIASTAFLGIFTVIVTQTITHFEDKSFSNLPVMDLLNNSMDIASADIDGDGDHDIIIASEWKPNLILLNDGKGHFSNGTEGRLPRKSYDSEDVEVADFDNDGDPDIIFASEDNQVHEYYLNDGKGFFTDVSDRLTFHSKANAVVACDFDRDGDIDLIFGNEGQDIYLSNDGKGHFTDETALRLPNDQNTTQDVEAADLDSDGDLDLVIGNEDGNRIYLNDGKGRFTDVTKDHLPLQGSEETRKVDLADIDRDGDIDIFFSNVNFRGTMNPANRVLVNNGKGVFTDQTTERYRGDNNLHTADASFIDLNGDNYLDMVVANIFGGYQQIFLNDGKGVFHEKTRDFYKSKLSTEVIAVETGDWNKDGKPDLYMGVFKDADALLFGK